MTKTGSASGAAGGLGRAGRALVRSLPSPLQERLRRGRRTARRGGADVRARLQPGSAEVPQQYVPQPFGPSDVRLIIGPANFAGQGYLWGKAAERVAGVTAHSVAVERPLRFPVDLEVPVPVYRSVAWGRLMQAHVLDDATHVMIEAMRPLLGILNGEDCSGDLEVLARHGKPTALVAHGSDVRLPSLHAQLYPFSPFADTSWDLVAKLERQAERFGRIMREFDAGPKFVSTPDLMDFIPDAVWLPTIVDVQRWQAAQRPVLRTARPVVLHAPSNARLKGSELAEPVLRALDDEGLITYRRVEGVAPADMPGLVAEADVLLEQLVLGLYSVAAIEGMAAGKLVLAHVHARVRERLPRQLPVVEADPVTLEGVLREIVHDRDRYREIAAEGPSYVAEVHDGSLSSRVLAAWLTASGQPVG